MAITPPQLVYTKINISDIVNIKYDYHKIQI